MTDMFLRPVLGVLEGCDESVSGRRPWGLGGALGRGTRWGGSGGWCLASVCRATAELCSLGLGAMAEVSTIVDKVKEVLSFQQS